MTERIVGVSTLAIFPIPTAWRAWIEDVIVDESRNGQGIGTALTEAMLDHARLAGCKTVDLTSRPHREAANHMYRKMGFVERNTNVYRYDLGRSSPVKALQPVGLGGIRFAVRVASSCRRGRTPTHLGHVGCPLSSCLDCTSFDRRTTRS